MAQGKFSASVSDFVRQAKARQEAVYKEAAARTLTVMQEPGPSKATAAKAVAVGAGLGKALKGGRRGNSKQAFGPITNPGGTGNLPVHTGFLRSSLVIALGPVQLPTRRPPEDVQQFTWDDSAISLATSGATISDPIEARYTAVYARRIDYQYKFVGLAAQQWPQIVDATCKDVKARTGG